MGYGFREVIVDQPFSGKWTEVDMNLGGGHGTFQGTKFSDSAGGYSYKKSLNRPRQAVENRFMFWRILNDVLELTESSMDYNLEDNQLRIVFPDSPIVGPISVQEMDNTVVILVMTVTSINRFIFTHPGKTFEDGKMVSGNKLPSIFQQATVRPIMKFSTFPLFEHTINIPVPITAASSIMPNVTGHIFAMAYESGGVTICKVTNDDNIICHDLRQSNLLTKILSYTPSILRSTNNTCSMEAVVGLHFFTAKIVHERKDIFLVTLSMNGHLRLYMCGNLNTIDSWTLVNDVVIDKRFGISGFTDSTMMLRKYQDQPKDYPFFAVFMPGHGFKLFQCLRDTRGPEPPKLIFGEGNFISFREKPLIDFCFTTKFLFTLINNPDEETDWEVKSYDLTGQHAPRFNLTLLEPPPRAEVCADAVDAEPKDFYTDLIFNKSPFSVNTIYSALSMFKNSNNFPKPESDWELTKLYALRVIDSEIRAVTAESDEPVADDEFRELNFKFWGEFYTSCVEYHVNTVKPLGVFFEHNTSLLCIVKKARISFLRPTDFLETAFYFPHLITNNNSVVAPNHLGSFLKYLEILELLESCFDEFHNAKIAKRLYQEKYSTLTLWDELANLLIDTDPNMAVPERRHFISMLTSKLRDLGSDGTRAMKQMTELLSSWDMECETEEEPQNSDMDTEQIHVPIRVSQYLMGSRLGANVAYHILKQLLNIRYVLGRNTLLLHAVLNQFLSHGENVEIQMIASVRHRQMSKSTVYRCFSLLSLCEKSGEFVHENWSENGRKVATLLNCSVSDQLIHGKIPESWPIKLIELFSYSYGGGLAIRSRVQTQNQPTAVLAYADAIGRALWINEDSAERPFEEFMISSGQYNALSVYSNHLKYYRRYGVEKSVLSTFYKGVADLFLRNPLEALRRFLVVSPLQFHTIAYAAKLFGVQDKPETTINAFFEKAISLFQVFGCLYAVERLAQKALAVSVDSRSRLILSVLGFKSALALGDYERAFLFILGMPAESIGAGRESSIRTFVVRILEKRDIDVLVNLQVDDYTDTIRRDIEKVLHAQTRLSDPMAQDSVYQMVYFYHLSRNNFEKAALVLLERIIEVGTKGTGRAALEIQRDSYLDILSCLTLIKEEEEGKERGSISLGGLGSGDGVDAEEWLNTLQNVRISPTPEPQVSDEYSEMRKSVKSFEQMLMDCELCISLLLLTDDKEVTPIKSDYKREKAKVCVQQLIQIHHYDQAIKLASMWKISYLPIVSALAQTCSNLIYDMPSEKGDIDYVKHIDTSDFPNPHSSAADIGLMALKKYVTTLERNKETKLHQEVTLILLRHCINLPRWLLDSYKRKDVNQLMLCYMRFGDWEEAADLAMEVLDVCLGRRDAKDYDPSIQLVSPYVAMPIIPYTTIEDLANQMNVHLEENPAVGDLLQNLREKCDDFVIRVLETRMDRRHMFAH